MKSAFFYLFTILIPQLSEGASPGTPVTERITAAGFLFYKEALMDFLVFFIIISLLIIGILSPEKIK